VVVRGVAAPRSAVPPPASGKFKRAAMASMRVDLPEPFSPMRNVMVRSNARSSFWTTGSAKG
jgi:hypothetical protein